MMCLERSIHRMKADRTGSRRPDLGPEQENFRSIDQSPLPLSLACTSWSGDLRMNSNVPFAPQQNCNKALSLPAKWLHEAAPPLLVDSHRAYSHQSGSS